jgi:hypothetical protein
MDNNGVRNHFLEMIPDPIIIDSVSLSNNTKMFFDMSKNTTKEPVLQRNGMINSVIASYSAT